MTILDYNATPHENGGVRITLTSGPHDWEEAHFPNVTVEQMAYGAAQYAGGKLIQQAYPFLTPSEREFLMTGMTDDEWNEVFQTADDDIDEGEEFDSVGLDLDEMIELSRAAGIHVVILDTPEAIDKFFAKRLDAEMKHAELAAQYGEGPDEVDEEPDANICPGCDDQDSELGPNGLCPTCHEESVAPDNVCPICGRDGCAGYCETGYGVY